jgi:hypothetical protein
MAGPLFLLPDLKILETSECITFREHTELVHEKPLDWDSTIRLLC